MTYKESVDLFQMLVSNRARVSGIPVPQLDKHDIVVLLSMAQSEIQSEWKPTIQKKQLNYVSNESIYNLSTSLTNLESAGVPEEETGYGTHYGEDYGNS